MTVNNKNNDASLNTVPSPRPEDKEAVLSVAASSSKPNHRRPSDVRFRAFACPSDRQLAREHRLELEKYGGLDD